MKKLITLVHQLITKSSHQLIITLANLLIITSVFAQAPEKMSYQAVIRNSSDALVTNTQIGLEVNIRQGTSSGTVVYTETQTPTTNANGLVSIVIGGGSGFNTIDWANGPYFLETKTAVAPPLTTYTITITNQMLSVPYAMHAKTAETVTGGITETDPVYDLSVASGITSVDTSNWNASYNWGNHASAGYLTAESQNISNVLTQGNNAGNQKIVNVLQQGIGTATPDPSAALEVNSTTQGLLLPRMTTTQIDAINNPAAGLIVFNVYTSMIQLFNGLTWVNIDGSLICGTSTITDYDSNVYNTVKIGNQCWMKENLKTTHYADGTALVDGTSAGDITGNYTTKYWFVYGNSLANKDIYGLHYTWAAAMNGAASSTANPSGIQGVCPSGWHLPSDAEWTQLTDFLGGESVAGGKMKETGTSHWFSPNYGATNESGFTALPGGYRYFDSSFYTIGFYGRWWSATESNATHAWKRSMYYYLSDVTRDYYSKDYGFSVRCLKD